MNALPHNAKTISSRCPGKIILSGEHAVVYDCPALVMATQRYAYADLETLETPHVALFFNGETVGLSPVEKLVACKQETDLRYKAFKEGHCGIRDVVPAPADLLNYTIANFFNTLGKPFEQGLQVELKLEIPMGRGMGSSAALILALLKVLNTYAGDPLSQDRLYALALASENLQHGKSSGVDPYTCLHGGIMKFVKGETTPLPPPPGHLYLVDTGAPEATTGECVEAVRKNFSDSGLWAQFTATTDYIEQAMLNTDLNNFRTGLRKNHQLLCALGLVPDPVEEFIGTIMHQGGAAKICGAGSIKGPHAGMVLVELEGQNPKRYADEFGYSVASLSVDSKGACLV